METKDIVTIDIYGMVTLDGIVSKKTLYGNVVIMEALETMETPSNIWHICKYGNYGNTIYIE